MQYIFVHRLVQQFTKQFVGDPIGFHFDYKNWINERSMRPFLDDADQRVIFKSISNQCCVGFSKLRIIGHKKKIL